METIAFSSGENTYFLFLIGAGEVEARKISTCVYIAATHAKRLYALRDHLIDRLLREKIVVRLVNVCYLDCLAYFKRSCIGFFLSHYKTEKSGFSGSVRTDNADNPVRWEHKVKAVEKFLVGERFGEALGFDHLVAEARPVGYENLELFLALLLVFIEKFIIAVESGFSFGLTGLRSHADPFEFPLESLPALARLLLFLSHPFCFLIKP